MQLRLLILALSVTTLLSACESTIESSSAPTLKTASNFSTRKSGTTYSSASSSRESSGVRQIEEDEASRALFKTAERMLQEGDLTSATILYRRAVENEPESVPALRGLAKLYEAQDRPREALETWRAITALDDTYAEAHRGMGRNLMAMELYNKAIESLKKAHALGGDDDLKTMNLLAMAQLRNGDEETAIATLKEAVEKSNDLDTRNNLGFAYIMAGQVGAAIKVLEEVVLDPKSTAQQRQNLALAYGLAGREEDARQLALQDLPPKAVAKNLKTYRNMRAQLLGKSAAPKKHVAKKKLPEPGMTEVGKEEVMVPLEKKKDTAVSSGEPKPQPLAEKKPAPATAPTPAALAQEAKPVPAVKKAEPVAEKKEEKAKEESKPAPSLAAEPAPESDDGFLPPPTPAPINPVRGMSMPPDHPAASTLP